MTITPEQLAELVKRLRDHVRSHGGPAKDENGKAVGTVWPMMLEAATALEQSQADLKEAEAKAREFVRVYDAEVKRLCDEHERELEGWQTERNVARGDQERAEAALKEAREALNLRPISEADKEREDQEYYTVVTGQGVLSIAWYE